VRTVKKTGIQDPAEDRRGQNRKVLLLRPRQPRESKERRSTPERYRVSALLTENVELSPL